MKSSALRLHLIKSNPFLNVDIKHPQHKNSNQVGTSQNTGRAHKKQTTPKPIRPEEEYYSLVPTQLLICTKCFKNKTRTRCVTTTC